MLARCLSRALLGLILSSLVLLFAHAEDTPCTVHAESKFYDLNPLKAKQDYQIKMGNGKTLSLNICQSVKTELFGLRDGVEAADVAGFIRLSHGDFSVGKVNDSLAVYDSRPRFTLSEGNRCKAKAGDATEHIRASSVLEFICDKYVSGVGIPRLVAALPPGDEESGCAFVIEWRTPHACPTSEGFSFVGFLAALGMTFLGLLLTYTIAGALYNRFVLDLRGYDQIPQFSFESMRYHATEAFEWTRDMVGIVAVNFLSRSGGSGGSCSAMSAENPRTPNPVSHQAQVSGFASDVERQPAARLPAGFNRSQPSPKTAFQRNQPQINPASHQAQVAQSLSFGAASPPRQPNPSIAQKPKPESRQSTQEERDFMLGDGDDDEEDEDEDEDDEDDDDDAQELGEISTAPHPTAASATLSGSTPGAQVVSPPSTPTPTTNPAAAARGRDLGAQGTIHL